MPDELFRHKDPKNDETAALRLTISVFSEENEPGPYSYVVYPTASVFIQL